MYKRISTTTCPPRQDKSQTAPPHKALFPAARPTTPHPELPLMIEQLSPENVDDENIRLPIYTLSEMGRRIAILAGALNDRCLRVADYLIGVLMEQAADPEHVFVAEDFVVEKFEQWTRYINWVVSRFYELLSVEFKYTDASLSPMSDALEHRAKTLAMFERGLKIEVVSKENIRDVSLDTAQAVADVTFIIQANTLH